MMAENNDSLLGADQLPNGEGMINADEMLAAAIESTIEDESMNVLSGGGLLTNRVIRTVQERFTEAKRQRDGDEQRWLDAYQNYRGHYSRNVKFTEHEKSRVFVKVTKTKVLAAYGQLVDVMFANNKFPIAIQATDVPEGAKETVHLGKGTQQPQPNIEATMGGPKYLDTTTPLLPGGIPNIGYAGDGYQPKLGESPTDISHGLEKRLKDAELSEGISYAGEPELRPADAAAKRMEKLIHDQIEESNGASELRSALFEAALLGTGVIKGPFNYNKTVHVWERDENGQRNYVTKQVRVPRIEFCSLWDFYAEPGTTSIDEAEWVIQRHKMSKSQLRGLKNRPYFDINAINDVLNQHPNYTNEDFENTIQAENSNTIPSVDKYEVLEYWGVLDKKDVEQAGIPLDDIDNMEEVQVNAWVCNNKLLRIVLNPFKPKRIPYLVFSYERNPYSIYGIGVAENMADSQMIMNGHARMAIDNLALAGNMVLDVDESAMVPGQSMEVFPGKIFKRAAGVPGQAIYGIKFPNTAPENLQMFDKFRQIADEATGIPSYAHGQTGVMSTTRTAAGMSMLMGAASLNIKTVVKNIDDFLLKPLGEALFHWNMAFYEGDLEIFGDLEVKAGGTSSLVQKEVRSQRLTNFMQVIQNPALAPFVKMPQLIKAFCESLELDPDEFINDQNEAQVYAAIIGMAGGMPQAQGAPMPGMAQGQMGVPGVPMPAEQGFTGNPEGMSNGRLPEEAA